MAWQEIELLAEVGMRRETMLLHGEPLFRPSHTGYLPEPMDHDRMKDDEEPRDFQEEGEEEEEDWEMTEHHVLPGMSRSGPSPLEPTHLPSATERRSPGSRYRDEDYILFPSYEEAPRRDPRTARLAIINSSSSLPSAMDPLMCLDSMDDSYLQHPPTRHVDYLTHDWTEEDICASWRQIVIERQEPSAHQPRLENASWRMWAKTRWNLATLPPDAINWIKDEDTTWLYGPLHSTKTWSLEPASTTVVNETSQSLKPILKRPSLEEILLQRSVSDLSLVRLPQSSSSFSSRSSSSSSHVTVPQMNPRSCRIRDKSVTFHEEVLQCVAIENDHVLLESSITCTEMDYPSMKRPSHVRWSSAPLTKPKTIESLPSTTLKPEATHRQPRATVDRARTWPSRTLSYLWDQENRADAPQTLPTIGNVNSSLQPEEKSVFEEDDEDQVEWNPPRPRRFPTNSESKETNPTKPNCTVMNNTLSQEPPITYLADEESFETEMFGFPRAQPPRFPSLLDKDVEMGGSDHSSPSNSEYLSSSTEDFEDMECTPSIFSVVGLRPASRTPSPSDDSDTSSSMDRNIQTPNNFSPTDGPMSLERSENYFSYLAPASLYPTSTKDRNIASACSTELNKIYGADSFAVQRPLAMDTTMTVDEEEHWWSGV